MVAASRLLHCIQPSNPTSLCPARRRDNGSVSCQVTQIAFFRHFQLQQAQFSSSNQQRGFRRYRRTPEFGSRRGISQVPIPPPIVSRNSSSMKKFFGSIRRKDAQSSDGGSSAQPSKAANSDHFNSASSKRASHTSLSKLATVPSTPPVITPLSHCPSLSTPTGANGSFAEAVGQSVSGGLASPTSPSGPKPSELCG